MLSIKNKTGAVNDTKVYDEKGNDITLLLSCYRIELDLPVGELVCAKLHCYTKEIEFENVVVENRTTKNKIDKLHNYYEMKKHGFSMIN